MNKVRELSQVTNPERLGRTDLAAAIALTEPGRLEMVEQNALRFLDDIAYDDGYNGLVTDAGQSVAEAFDLLYYLERAARVQLLARSTGLALRQVRPEVARETYRAILADTPRYADAHFEALKRILDREAPDYKS
jgi:hypothetical protein